MSSISLHCNRCGTALTVAPTTNYVTCNHCGAHLVVRRTDNATFTELAGAPALQQLAQRVDRIAQQNEVANIDREWQMERERYMVTGRYGQRYIPTPGLSLLGGIAVVAFGVIWTLIAGAITAGVGGPALLFPCFGVVFIAFGIGVSAYAYNKAQQYQRAYDAYQRRRMEAVNRARGEG
jgi:hypothetical protein